MSGGNKILLFVMFVLKVSTYAETKLSQTQIALEDDLIGNIHQTAVELTKVITKMKEEHRLEISELKNEFIAQRRTVLQLQQQVEDQQKIIDDIKAMSMENPNRSDLKLENISAKWSRLTVRKVAARETRRWSNSFDPRMRLPRFVRTPVAFCARVTPANLNVLGARQTIVFDHVLENTGSGYVNAQGVFIAPVAGLYLFSASVTSAVGEEFQAAIKVNGQSVAHIYTYGAAGRSDQSSQTVVSGLKMGDVVSVEREYFGTSILGSGGFSTFSGFLLYAA